MNSVDIGRYKRIINYLWDPEPRNDLPDEPIWCLGIRYPPNHRGWKTQDQDGSAQGQYEQKTIPTEKANEHQWPEEFLDDVESRIWITYRSNFTPIPKPPNQEANPAMTLTVHLRSQLMDSQGFTSDTGWGCMIRSGQSLLANAMLILLLGRDWRRGTEAGKEAQLLHQFADHPEAPFSIHRFVQHGAEFCNKYPGEWFGPSATARCIQALVAQQGSSELRVYITDDTADIYEDKFARIAQAEHGDFIPTLILVGTRLGIDHVTPAYWDALKEALQLPQSVGIAGGRPSASHYFIGVHGQYLFYLDPHHTRPASLHQDVNDTLTHEEVNTYHTRRLRRIHIKDMDPSMLIGFIIRSREDWTDWKTRILSGRGNSIVHILSEDTANHQARKEAIDEVEALDD
ncbi:cysteine protease ATG4 [Aspergillus clavatus NRRL 1]|uniref:Probable cysteine protease atg4 n=1 Tax=Aspergillus clavatus (strain ATCC 1007 / CBS 513.65 / DSM 816 / NCTC 3887 / NRRL 1 / QM 1276 / 107) TaxID=344612 RepID=ATG4_ASPCL|nr:peptidase family C54 protein [Aspergillus clavatus NRRL 1]A1CJ08.1 RecName: Full=Probable cysteine protease atg4; AltName: Full=Autophagy-related protein 4 [Aspergillus clavatus NRRL 1]EAW09132.1 peptidase family C54 protein [Aspergillus clavatus NRRL 1]